MRNEQTAGESRNRLNESGQWIVLEVIGWFGYDIHQKIYRYVIREDNSLALRY